MKKVSFKVAEAIKEVGYPQGNTDKCYLTADHNQYYKKGQIVENEDGEWTVLTKNLADIPTYIETWLWLWREKKIFIETKIHFDSVKGYYVTAFIICDNVAKHIETSDPEEAIEKAIEYLVDNKLLK